MICHVQHQKLAKCGSDGPRHFFVLSITMFRSSFQRIVPLTVVSLHSSYDYVFCVDQEQQLSAATDTFQTSSIQASRPSEPVIQGNESVQRLMAMGKRAKEMISGRREENTKDGYRRSTKNVFVPYIKLHAPEQFDAAGACRLPVPRQLVESFFGELTDKRPGVQERNEALRALQDAHNDDEFLEDVVNLQSTTTDAQSSSNRKRKFESPFYSPSTVQGHKSALKFFYEENGVKFDEVLSTDIDKLIAGYKAFYQKKKLDAGDGMKMGEGKTAFSYASFVMLSAKFMTLIPTTSMGKTKGNKTNNKKGNWSQSYFAWPFMTMQWNLMARSITIADVALQHLSWSGDSMVVHVPKHKGDTKGTNVAAMDKHVFANPLNPKICSILSLAVLFACSPTFTTNRLFDGTTQEKRFGEILRDVLVSCSREEVLSLGCDIGDFGTHSSRKGASSFALSMPGGPSAVSVFLRAGWSLGDVRDRYIMAGQGADQLCGRFTAGITLDSKFATLPPHFTKAGLALLTDEIILANFPSYKQYPVGFQGVIPFLMASLVYHWDFLTEALDSRHPIFQSHLAASGTISSLKPHVVTGVGECADTGMRATGIPIEIVTAVEVQKLVTTIGVQQKQIEDMRQEIGRLPGKVAELNQDIPGKVYEKIVSNFQINGVSAMTPQDLRNIHDQNLKQIETLLNTKLAQIGGNTTAPLSCDSQGEWMQAHSSIPPPPTSDNRFEWFPRPGQMFSRVPVGFKMPRKLDMRCYHDRWNYGHLENKILPYRLIQRSDLDSTVERTQLARAQGVMKAVEDIALENGHLSEGQSFRQFQNILQSGPLFDAAYNDLIARLYPSGLPKRHTEIAIGTLYEKVCNYNKGLPAAATEH